MEKGKIYLEPRATFDAALCNANMVWYSFTLLIDVLINDLGLEYTDAVDYYCFNIESLTLQGLVVIEDDND